MSKPNLNRPEIVRKERRGLAVMLSAWKAAVGIKSGALFLLGLPVAGAFYAGHVAGKAEVSALKSETAAETGWRFAKSREEETGSILPQAARERNPFPKRDSLEVVAKANAGKLADLERGIEGSAVKAADTKEAAAEAAGSSEEAAPNILSGLEDTMAAAKKGGEAGGAGFGKMRDSLNSGSGFGMSGGVMRGFEKPQLSNQILAKQDVVNQAMGRARAFSRNAQSRVKTAARSRVAPAAIMNGQNVNRLSRMQAAMAPTKAGGDEEGNSSVHNREWTSAEGSGSSYGGAARRIGDDGEIYADAGSGSGLGSPINGRSSQQSGELPQAPRVKGEDKSPNKDLLQIGQMLITAATISLMLAGLFKQMADGDPNSGWMIAVMIAAGAAVVAAAGAIGVGAAVASKGDALQGTIFIVVGLILGILAAIVFADAYSGYNAGAAAEGAAADAAADGAGADSEGATKDAVLDRDMGDDFSTSESLDSAIEGQPQSAVDAAGGTAVDAAGGPAADAAGGVSPDAAPEAPAESILQELDETPWLLP